METGATYKEMELQTRQISSDANILIAEFLKEEEAKRNLVTASNHRTAMAMKGRKRGDLSAKQIKKHARRCGLVVTTGNGRHGIQIKAPDGSFRPVPDHGSRKRMGNGTRNGLLDFIDQHRRQVA